tara:strand:- start:410 stop:820 length:411 start_codon:yes stop_codon:yes gene_type:complete
VLHAIAGPSIDYVEFIEPKTHNVRWILDEAMPETPHEYQGSTIYAENLYCMLRSSRMIQHEQVSTSTHLRQVQGLRMKWILVPTTEFKIQNLMSVCAGKGYELYTALIQILGLRISPPPFLTCYDHTIDSEGRPVF